MRVDEVSFGRIVIDGTVYTDDIVVDRGMISNRNKSVSRRHKGLYGHTPLSIGENIPWDCSTLIVGTGMYGSLPVEDEVLDTADRLGVTLVLKKTMDAVLHVNDKNTNLVLHLTC